MTTATTPKNTTPTTLSVHQWIRSAIHASQQLTSAIVVYLWNFRHRLVRYYWYAAIPTVPMVIQWLCEAPQLHCRSYQSDISVYSLTWNKAHILRNLPSPNLKQGHLGMVKNHPVAQVSVQMGTPKSGHHCQMKIAIKKCQNSPIFTQT